MGLKTVRNLSDQVICPLPTPSPLSLGQTRLWMFSWVISEQAAFQASWGFSSPLDCGQPRASLLAPALKYLNFIVAFSFHFYCHWPSWSRQTWVNTFLTWKCKYLAKSVLIKCCLSFLSTPPFPKPPQWLHILLPWKTQVWNPWSNVRI